MPEYAQGGCVEGTAVPVLIDPHECMVSAGDVRAGRLRCSRIGHPTPFSLCAAPRTLPE